MTFVQARDAREYIRRKTAVRLTYTPLLGENTVTDEACPSHRGRARQLCAAKAAIAAVPPSSTLEGYY